MALGFKGKSHRQKGKSRDREREIEKLSNVLACGASYAEKNSMCASCSGTELECGKRISRCRFLFQVAPVLAL